MNDSLRQWTGLAAALFLLNAALSFHNVWPTLGIELRPELSVEAATLVLFLAGWRRLRGRPGAGLFSALAIVLLVMMLGRYMEVTAPALYGRAVNLYWDARYVPDVVAMFAAQSSALEVAGIAFGIVGGAFVVLWLLYRIVATIADALEVPGPARVLRLLAAVLVVAYLVGYYASAPTLRWFSIPVSQTYARQVRFVADALAGPGALESLPVTDPLAVIDPATLPQRDVIVTFVESYGAVAYDDDALDARLAAPRERFADAVAASGQSVVSGWFRAPTTGGGSWLSHISFMTGLWIDDAARYEALLTQSRTTLPKVFSAAGFRTLAWMPGLKNDWPEGRFYGFDRIEGTQAIDYRGPKFGWWEIPDQFALARLDAAELAARDRAPAFVFFPTISTHAPFRPTPPYQADWERLLGAAPFAGQDLSGLTAPLPSMAEMKDAYGDALAYTYDYWSGYLSRTAGRDALLVLLGDHQPPASVAGQGARRDVPVHVIGRDPAIVGRLRSLGFVDGLVPAEEPVGRLDEIGPLLFGR